MLIQTTPRRFWMFVLVTSCATFLGCAEGSSESRADSGGSDSGGSDSGGSDSGATDVANDTMQDRNLDTSIESAVDATSDVPLADGGNCQPFPNVPISGDTRSGALWDRPRFAMCGDTRLPDQDSSRNTRYDIYTFCGGAPGTVYNIRVANGTGSPIQDSLLFVYPGTQLPADLTSCLAVNDDEGNCMAPDNYDACGSLLPAVTIPPSGAVTVVVTGTDNGKAGTYTLTLLAT